METGVAPSHGVDDDYGGFATDGAGRIFKFGFHAGLWHAGRQMRKTNCVQIRRSNAERSASPINCGRPS